MPAENRSERPQRVFKYATGDEIPPGAQFLSTQVQDLPPEVAMRQHEIGGPTWLVWHYFLVPDPRP